MSMEFLESFDHYNTSDELVAKWTSANGCTIVPGRNGQGLALGSAFKSLSLQTEWIVGFAFNINATTGLGASTIMYQIGNVGTVVASLAIDTDGSISLWAGNGFNHLIASTLSAAPPFYVHPKQWYYCEIKWTIFSGMNMSVAAALKINNVTVASGSASSGIDSNLFIVPNSGANTHEWFNIDIFGNVIIDDINIKNASGAHNNDFVGDLRIGVLFPRADVLTQWTGLVPGNQFSQINAQFPLGDASYVYATIDPHAPTTPSDNFNWQPVSPFVGSIIAVQYLIYARKDDEGTRQVQQFFGSPGSALPGALSPLWSLGDTYLYYYYDMDTNPSTGSPWTVADFNASQFGFQLLG